MKMYETPNASLIFYEAKDILTLSDGGEDFGERVIFGDL